MVRKTVQKFDQLGVALRMKERLDMIRCRLMNKDERLLVSEVRSESD